MKIQKQQNTNRSDMNEIPKENLESILKEYVNEEKLRGEI